MSNKVKGYITFIGEPETLSNGAKKLNYRIKSDNEYDRADWSFEMYKKPEHQEHIENFIKFNSVGDRVEVEYTVKPSEWKGRYFINLSHWKIEKLTEQEDAIQGEALTAAQMGDDSDIDSLPF